MDCWINGLLDPGMLDEQIDGLIEPDLAERRLRCVGHALAIVRRRSALTDQNILIDLPRETRQALAPFHGVGCYAFSP
jgi:hypothetical protein